MKRIEIVSKDKRVEMKKYLDAYLKEISKYDDTIVFDKKGNPEYKYFKYYFTDEGRYPIYFYVDEKIAGIALVREVAAYSYEIAEFYVFPEFRKDGNALDFANMINMKFLGNLRFSTRKENFKAVRFWERFVNQFESVESIKGDKWVNWSVKR